MVELISALGGQTKAVYDYNLCKEGRLLSWTRVDT